MVPDSEQRRDQKRVWSRAYYAANPELVKARAAAWRVANPGRAAASAAAWNVANPERRHRVLKVVMVEMMDGACEDCGMDLLAFPMCADFDHVDPSEKEFGISMPNRRATPEQIVRELMKCRLLCANCHRIRTAAPKKARKKPPTPDTSG